MREFIADNPQVSSSIITATCGILGIFINIFINIGFRNKDYKNKNRMRQIEILETYYTPLCDNIRNFKNSIQNIPKKADGNFYDFYKALNDAKYASKTEDFKLVLQELYSFLDKEAYKFFDDYKLFKLYKRIKERSFLLSQLMKKKVKESDIEISGEILLELDEFIYRIQVYEIRLLTNNVIIRQVELIKLWWNYKITEK